MSPARVPEREADPVADGVVGDPGPGPIALPAPGLLGAPAAQRPAGTTQAEAAPPTTPTALTAQPSSAHGEARAATIHGRRGLTAPAHPGAARPGATGDASARSTSVGVVGSVATARRSAVSAVRGTSPGLAATTVLPPERPADPPDPGDARPASRPHPVRRRLRVGSLGVGQIVAVQAALLAVVIRLGHETWLTWSTDALGGLVVVLALVPVGGRWLYQHLLVLVGFALRRHRLIVRPGLADPALLPGVALPGSVISTLDLDDSDIGLVEHPQGVTVVLAAQPGGHRAWSVAELLERLPLAEHDLRVQMLVVQVPARNAANSEIPFVTSYSGLAAGRPAYRETWFAVQAPRTPACHSDDDMAELVGGVLRGVRRRLAKERMPLRLLTTGQLTDLFRTTMRLDPSAEIAMPGHHAADDPDDPESMTNCPVCRRDAERRAGIAQETFFEWRVPGGVQTCFTVVDWPDPERVPYDTVFDTLTAAPGSGTVLALATRPGPEGASSRQLECAIRLWADETEALAKAVHRLIRAARTIGVELDRHNGGHRARVPDTLPFGGFVT